MAYAPVDSSSNPDAEARLRAARSMTGQALDFAKALIRQELAPGFAAIAIDGDAAAKLPPAGLRAMISGVTKIASTAADLGCTQEGLLWVVQVSLIQHTVAVAAAVRDAKDIQHLAAEEYLRWHVQQVLDLWKTQQPVPVPWLSVALLSVDAEDLLPSADDA